jgi:hypothetical protein
LKVLEGSLPLAVSDSGTQCCPQPSIELSRNGEQLERPPGLSDPDGKRAQLGGGSELEEWAASVLASEPEVQL